MSLFLLFNPFSAIFYLQWTSRCKRKCSITWKSRDSLCSSFIKSSILFFNKPIWSSMQNFDVNRCQFYAIQAHLNFISTPFSPFDLNNIIWYHDNGKEFKAKSFCIRVICLRWTNCDAILKDWITDFWIAIILTKKYYKFCNSSVQC